MKIYLDGLTDGDYTSDFLCKKTDGIQVNKLNISKPLLGQKVKVPYTDYANLQATVKEIDRVRDEAATETKKAVAMMRDDQQLMNNANEIISERDYIISEAREQAIVEAKKKRKDS